MIGSPPDIEGFWSELQTLLEAYGKRLVAKAPSVTARVGRSQNANFVLRAYLSLMRSNAGDEVAVTVNATIIGDKIEVVSDASSDGGAIINPGPGASISLDDLNHAKQGASAQWFQSFEGYLSSIVAQMESEVAKLR